MFSISMFRAQAKNNRAKPISNKRAAVVLAIMISIVISSFIFLLSITPAAANHEIYGVGGIYVDDSLIACGKLPDTLSLINQIGNDTQFSDLDVKKIIAEASCVFYNNQNSEILVHEQICKVIRADGFIFSILKITILTTNTETFTAKESDLNRFGILLTDSNSPMCNTL